MVQVSDLNQRVVVDLVRIGEFGSVRETGKPSISGTNFDRQCSGVLAIWWKPGIVCGRVEYSALKRQAIQANLRCKNDRRASLRGPSFAT